MSRRTMDRLGSCGAILLVIVLLRVTHGKRDIKSTALVQRLPDRICKLRLFRGRVRQTALSCCHIVEDCEV